MNFQEIKKNIDTKGYHVEENFFSNVEVEILRNFVDIKLKENNYQYFFLTSNTIENNLLNNKLFFEKIDKLLKSLTIEFVKKINLKDEIYKVLRVVTGKKSNKVSLKYHFDAHLLTLLIPIYIPNRENSENGNLVIYRNLRKLHKNMLRNIFEKIFFQSWLFSKILKLNYVKKKLNEHILKLNPGNVYIFNGFRTLHTNLNIDPVDIRATLLVHYHDVFADSFLVKLNREIRIKKELRNIIQNKNN
jgi:hypothetical protein